MHLDAVSRTLTGYRKEIEELENRRPPVGTRMSYEADAIQQQRLEDIYEFVRFLENL